MIPERIQHNILVHINGSRTAWRSVSTCSVQAHFWMGMDGGKVGTTNLIRALDINKNNHLAILKL